MDPAGESKPSAGVEHWELDLIKKVASRFRTSQREDLEADLAGKLAALKKRPLPAIANWKAYLAKVLYNKAANWVRDLRARQRRELSTDFDSTEVQPQAGTDEPGFERLESEFELSRIQRRLDAESYAFLELIANSRGNLSRVARLRGEHRNTVRRRLQTIRAQINRPIENVSAPLDRPDEPTSKKGLAITARERDALIRITKALGSRERDAFKARLILALAAGHSYVQIQEHLKTTAPTISRWKRRFEADRLEGLKAKYRGRNPRMDMRLLVENWQQTVRRSQGSGRPSYRKLARQLGISSSTVHRILSARPLHRKR